MRKMQLKKLTPRHLSMMEALNIEGKSQREVSTLFGISETWLSLLKKDPLWQAKEAEYKQFIQKACELRICQMIPKALNALEQALDNPKSSVQLKAALEILKKSGIDGKSCDEAKTSIVLNMIKPRWMEGESETYKIRHDQTKD